MNAFDLNRKEYIRVNNAGGDPLTDFSKVTFLTSFVITGNSTYPLPITYVGAAIDKSNSDLVNNINDYCVDYYPDGGGYACYIVDMGVVNIAENVNIPYAKINVYAMNGLDITI